MLRVGLCSLCLLTVLACTIGCSPSQSVTSLDGKLGGKLAVAGDPVRNAELLFVPATYVNEGNWYLPYATALTDEQGNFELVAEHPTKTLANGLYDVWILKGDSVQPEFLDKESKQWNRLAIAREWSYASRIQAKLDRSTRVVIDLKRP